MKETNLDETLAHFKPLDKVIEEERRNQPVINIDDIVSRGKEFHSKIKTQTGSIISLGIYYAFKDALNHAKNGGYVVTMPELIATMTDKSHNFKQKFYCTHTEENVGIDTKGRYYEANKPVIIIVNGGGIFTLEKLMKAQNYSNHSYHTNAKYETQEFDDLLDGKLPSGDSIELYTFKEIKKGVSDLPHRFGVVIPHSLVLETDQYKRYNKKDFVENPLVIARAGGVEYLESYYEMAKTSLSNPPKDYSLGNNHGHAVYHTETPHGCVLYMELGGFAGLSVANIHMEGRFVGVAPGTQKSKKVKKSITQPAHWLPPKDTHDDLEDHSSPRRYTHRNDNFDPSLGGAA